MFVLWIIAVYVYADYMYINFLFSVIEQPTPIITIIPSTSSAQSKVTTTIRETSEPTNSPTSPAGIALS